MFIPWHLLPAGFRFEYQCLVDDLQADLAKLGDWRGDPEKEHEFRRLVWGFERAKGAFARKRGADKTTLESPPEVKAFFDPARQWLQAHIIGPHLDAWAAADYWFRKLEGEPLNIDNVCRYFAARHGMRREETDDLTADEIRDILERDATSAARVAAGQAPLPARPPENGGAASPSMLPARHSRDFRSVHWYGDDYSFSPTQAACVKVLWEAWENGTPELGQATILEHPEVEADSRRLIDVFKGHPAWGKMIARGQTAGSFRLTEQPEGN
jgi:hypothetical protein